jgi:hypothetical protein
MIRAKSCHHAHFLPVETGFEFSDPKTRDTRFSMFFYRHARIIKRQ